jgi:hypothetical protein
VLPRNEACELRAMSRSGSICVRKRSVEGAEVARENVSQPHRPDAKFLFEFNPRLGHCSDEGPLQFGPQRNVRSLHQAIQNTCRIFVLPEIPSYRGDFA